MGRRTVVPFSRACNDVSGFKSGPQRAVSGFNRGLVCWERVLSRRKSYASLESVLERPWRWTVRYEIYFEDAT